MEAWYELQDNDNKDIWASYVARCYEGEPYIEIEWLVGPIPGLDGKEVVVTYKVLPSNDESEGKQDDLVEFFTTLAIRPLMMLNVSHCWSCDP